MADKSDKTLGQVLKEARVSIGITQTQLAERLGTQQPVISQWENNATAPTVEQRARITQVLGISFSDQGDKASESEETSAAPSAFGAWLNQTRITKKLSVAELSQKSGLKTVTIYAIESGRVENPRAQTREALSKALNEAVPDETTQQTEAQAKIEGVGELFDFDPHDENDWPNSPGIYVFYDISNRPVYVGQGQDIRVRIRDHFTRFWFKQPIVVAGAYVGVEDKELREKVEKLLIKFLKSNAVLNKQNVDR
jgi:transcriptional regulator with XRE-family HTH domain